MSGTTWHEDVRRLVRPYVVTGGRTRSNGDDLVVIGMLSVSRPTGRNEPLIRRLIDGVRSL